MDREVCMDYFGVEDPSQIRMLFCNIPWMKYYLGESDEDQIPEDSGGKPLDAEMEGSETDLFYPGILEDEECLVGIAFPGRHQNPFGYAEYKKLDLETHYKGQVQDLMTNQCVDDVLVVWVAQQHQDDKQRTEPVIVGWWKYATILRDYEEVEIDEVGENRKYNVMASAADAFLLDEDHRDFAVEKNSSGGSGFGHSNIWYAEKAEDHPFKEQVAEYIVRCEEQDLNRLHDFYDEFLIEDYE